MPCTFGVLAHVDAGKTTLSEQILYRAGVLRSPGRVDHGDTVLDNDPIERERGITVFSGQAWFAYQQKRFTLIDTPGHVDFAAEAERALMALDLAVLVVDGCAGLDAHASALFELAGTYGVPTLLFLNKTDLPAYDESRVLSQIAARLNGAAIRFADGTPDMDALAMLDDGFCERYLSGRVHEDDAWQALSRLFHKRRAFPLLSGAALSGQGVHTLLDALCRLAPHNAPNMADAGESCSGGPDALIYKVRREPNGDRVCFLKLLNGTLRPRDAFTFDSGVEKIHQIRLYRGSSYTLISEARAGDAVGVTGLLTPRCGDRLLPGKRVKAPRLHTQPVLCARVAAPQNTPPARLMEKLRLLEDEDPMLHAVWDEAHGAATVRVMGAVQAEVLTRLMLDRFGLSVALLPPLVLYRETIAAPVVGCGHYEPLRHYAEVHLLLSPGPRGGGVTFESRCHVDDLPANYQSLIRTHVLEREHRGVLTGSPLADVHVTLLSGRAHLKHTEGGDFREAVYRAIRQGLMKAQSILLEPFYRFTLTVPAECLGRAMSDILAMGGEYGAPKASGAAVCLAGRAPVRAFMDYPVALRAYTHGQGRVRLEADGYAPCQEPGQALAQCAYRCEADVQNPTGSIFCAHGAGFFVPWDQADAHMHLPVETPY